MKLIAATFIAGLVFSSTALADASAEERFRMKFGRGTPRAEAARKAPKTAAVQKEMDCGSCCGRMQHSH